MRGRDWVGAAASAAASIGTAALFGYSFGASSNHAFWLPTVLERLEPGLYAGDPAVAAALRGPTFFYDLLALLARPAGLEAAAALAWAVPAGAVGALAWASARTLGSGAGGGALAALFVATSGSLRMASPWAGDPLVKPFADHTSAAWALVLAGCTLLLARRRTAGWAVLGLGGLLNPLAAGLGAAWVLGAEALRCRGLPAARDQLGGLISATGAAACLAVLGRGARPDMALLSAATPNTYSAWGWPWERWPHGVVWALVWLAAASAHTERERLRALVQAGLGLAAAGLLAPVLGPLSLAQPLRIDAPLAWLGLVAAGGVLAARLSDARPAVWASGLAAAAGLAAPLPGTFLPLWSAALIAAPGALTRRFVALAGAGYGLAVPFFGPDSWAGAPFSGALAAAALGLLAALAPEGREGWPVWTRPSACIVLAAWLAVPLIAAARLPDPGEAASPVELAARASPAGSRFAVPPSASGFRLRARRPACAEWSDFNLALFDAAAARSWRARMAGLGVDWERLPAARATALREWDRDQLRRRRSPAAAGVPGWSGPEQAVAAARACGAQAAVVGGELLPTGPR